MPLQDDLRAARSAPPAAPRRRRWDLVAAWVVILGPALGIASWLALRQRVGDLEERLVRDANATFSRPLDRAVHVDRPLPGTFGAAVALHLPEIQRWVTSNEDDVKSLEGARGVASGARPLADLPPPYRAALVGMATALDGLLEGTHAERLDLPLAPATWTPCEGADWGGYQTAALFAALRVRRALAAGEPDVAMATCVDGLALGRDAALSSGLVGHMVGVAIVKRLWPACADAFARLDSAGRSAASARVRAVRDGFPSVAQMYRVDFLGMEVIALGRAMSGDARARLVALARAQIPAEPTAAWERLMARDAWRSMRGTWDKLLRVAERNRGLARDAGFAAVVEELERYVNPLAAIATPGGHAKYARRAEGAMARLDLLAATGSATRFRDEEGRWPASIGELAAGGLLSPAEADRLADATLDGPGARGALEVRLTVDTGDEKQPTEELVLWIRPPAPGRVR